MLKLMFAALLRTSKTWQRVVINEFVPSSELQQRRDLTRSHNFSLTNTLSGMCLMINMSQRQKPGV